MARLNDPRAKRKNSYDDIEFYLSEALGVGVTVTVLFLAISLISYHPHDNTMFHFESDLYMGVRNWGGLVGSYISSLLFHLLGAGAYILVGVLGIIAYMLLLGYRHTRSLWGITLLPICVVAASVISSLYGIDFVHELPGGMVGYLLNEKLTAYLGFYGAALLAWASMWVSTVVVLRMSIVRGIILLTRVLASSRLTFFFSLFF